MLVIVGGSLTAVTSRSNVSLAVLAPSLTVSVIVVLPDAFAAGVMVTLRVAPVPPNTMFPVGTTPVTEDVADSVRSAAAVLSSPTVTVSGPSAVSSGVV